MMFDLFMHVSSVITTTGLLMSDSVIKEKNWVTYSWFLFLIREEGNPSLSLSIVIKRIIVFSCQKTKRNLFVTISHVLPQIEVQENLGLLPNFT